MANIQKIYSDIDFSFTKKPVIGDIALSYDTQSVIRSIRNLILTKKYERPFNPELGSNIDAILFENISSSSEISLENEIKRMIVNYEPRVSLRTVKVSSLSDKNAYSVYITFFVENATLETTVKLLLERNR